MIGGFGSQIIAGRISDTFEKKSFKTKPFVCMFMSLIGGACAAIAFSTTFSFWFSTLMLFPMYLLGEGWMPPALAMIQTTIDVRYKAVSMAVFLFATAISGTIGTFVVGKVIDSLEEETQKSKGYIIALNTGIPCVLAAIMFFITSFYYEKHMQKQS